MTSTGLPAIAVVVAAALTGTVAGADTGPAVPTPFADGTFSSVGDAELAGEFGQGIIANSPLNSEGQESRLAVILWDETKRRAAPTGNIGGIEQAGGGVVISIGAAPGGAP